MGKCHSKHSSVVTLLIAIKCKCLLLVSFVGDFFVCWLGEVSVARHLMGSGHNIYH